MISSCIQKRNGFIAPFGDGNKTRKAKFCRPVGSGCLQCIETVPTAAYLEKVQSNAVKFKQKKKKKKNTINKVV